MNKYINRNQVQMISIQLIIIVLGISLGCGLAGSSIRDTVNSIIFALLGLAMGWSGAIVIQRSEERERGT